MTKLWVVEMWNLKRDRWEPTVSVGLDRSAGRLELAAWKARNPDDRFRLMPYTIRLEGEHE